LCAWEQQRVSDECGKGLGGGERVNWKNEVESERERKREKESVRVRERERYRERGWEKGFAHPTEKPK
jgi:hypothetical protein